MTTRKIACQLQCREPLYPGRPAEVSAARLEPNVRLLKLNTEAEQAIGSRYNIRSILAMLLFHHGKEIARQSGAMSADDIIRWTQSNLP
ncbi:MAG: thioredoxin domain-containing protein [Xanthomonadales bacterium]|nr:thioredoxin domain-containing protein [Xanthomonadales bacterium]